MVLKNVVRTMTGIRFKETKIRVKSISWDKIGGEIIMLGFHDPVRIFPLGELEFFAT